MSDEPRKRRRFESAEPEPPRKSRFDQMEPEPPRKSRFDQVEPEPSRKSRDNRSRSPTLSREDASRRTPSAEREAAVAARRAKALAAVAKLNAQIAAQGIQHAGSSSTIPVVVQQPKTDEGTKDVYQENGDYVKDIEINDYKNKYVVTRGSAQKQIKEETGADVTTRGSYIPPAAMATAAGPPLYLHVTSTTKEGLEKAVALIEEMLSKELPPLTDQRRFRNRDEPPPRQRWPEVHIPIDLEPIPGFNLRATVVGHGGQNVKHIQQHTNCRVQIKGRGSGFSESDTGKESDEAMFLYVAAPMQDQVDAGQKLCEELVENVKKRYEEFKETGRVHNHGHGGHQHGSFGGQNHGGYGGQSHGKSREYFTDMRHANFTEGGYSREQNNDSHGGGYGDNGYGGGYGGDQGYGGGYGGVSQDQAQQAPSTANPMDPTFGGNVQYGFDPNAGYNASAYASSYPQASYAAGPPQGQSGYGAAYTTAGSPANAGQYAMPGSGVAAEQYAVAQSTGAPQQQQADPAQVQAWADYYAANPSLDPYIQYGGYGAYMAMYGQYTQQTQGYAGTPDQSSGGYAPPGQSNGYAVLQAHTQSTSGGQAGYDAVPPPPSEI